MEKPQPTRTVAQLHFEDLDPHRFEDLVRQLAYGFRSWVTLEAIGRSGDDGGVDIRGAEAQSEEGFLEPGDSPDGEDRDSSGETPRTWLIQVKRERRLGPARARAVAAEAIFDSTFPPYGFILAAPADLSRRTRDALAHDLRARGVRQVIVWGRGELEDLLFDPRNDHLLFAYFGISLRIRQRSMTADLRQRLTKKRQIFAALGGLDNRKRTAVLLRDPTDHAYPDHDKVTDHDPGRPPWLWTAFRRHSNPDKVALMFRRQHAWLDSEDTAYDVLETCSHVMPGRNGFDKVPKRDEELCERAWRYFHNAIPEPERAWVIYVGWIPLDDILLVDDLGDALNGPPHLLVTRDHAHGFFTHVRAYIQREPRIGADRYLQPPRRALQPIEELQQTKKFPEPLPDVPWVDDPWQPGDTSA